MSTALGQSNVFSAVIAIAGVWSIDCIRGESPICLIILATLLYARRALKVIHDICKVLDSRLLDLRWLWISGLFRPLNHACCQSGGFHEDESLTWTCSSCACENWEFMLAVKSAAWLLEMRFGALDLFFAACFALD